jgi:hypothetical protein
MTLRENCGVKNSSFVSAELSYELASKRLSDPKSETRILFTSPTVEMI